MTGSALPIEFLARQFRYFQVIRPPLQSIPSNPHEHFEELAALAAGGHLEQHETRELDEHLVGCKKCQAFYTDMLALTASVQVEAEKLFPARVPITTPAVSNMVMMPTRQTSFYQSRGFAAAAAIIFGFLLGAGSFALWHKDATSSAAETKVPVASATSPVPALLETRAVETGETQKALHAAEARVATLEAALSTAQRHSSAPAALPIQTPAVVTLSQQQEAAYRAELGSLNSEVARLKQVHDQDGQALEARDMRIRLLTASQLTETASTQGSNGAINGTPSVAELLGQRNLHVIDVYDENSHGQRTASFGRVFYGEGASLLFYAFDLPVKPGADKVVVQAWGLREGSDKNPVRLGVFSQGNPALSRWSLRVKDPAQLKQIDAVYVTMERREEKKPTGAPLLYAYLRQAPNHP